LPLSQTTSPVWFGAMIPCTSNEQGITDGVIVR
jgi:hypothetical protein